MISENQLKIAAKVLGLEVAVIKAVADVESKGAGFLETGEPKILFEPHVFYAQLRKNGKNPEDYRKTNPDILYPVWGSKPYGKYADQHPKLARAIKIDRTSALESASWGRFQIMGYHWKTLGYSDIQGFINAMYKDEDAHLMVFVKFIQVNNLTKYLVAKDWDNFALRYNGKGYKTNKYDTKLEAAYERYN